MVASLNYTLLYYSGAEPEHVHERQQLDERGYAYQRRQHAAHADRCQKRPAVEPERQPALVVVIDGEALRVCLVAVPAYLLRTGQPGSDRGLEPRMLLLIAELAGDHLTFGNRQRTRPDKAHVPTYHVPELRQFVELPVPQYLAQPRYARVILAGAHALVLAARHHGAYLVDGENPAAGAEALLLEEHRPSAFQHNEQGCQQ